MASYTSAGTTFSVSASAPATYNAAGFGALTFTSVGEVTNIGEFAKVYALVTHNPVATRQTVKRKGSYNNGTIPLEFALDEADAGQIILRAASESDSSYSFRVVTQNGDIYYFSAQTMSFVINVGSVDQITAGTAQLEIDNDIILV